MIDFRRNLKAILNFEPPEDLCLFEPGYWPETLQRWRGEGLSAEQQPWEAVEGLTYYHRAPVQTRIFPAFERKVISAVGNHQVIQNEDGAILETLASETTFPRFIKHPVENMADFDRLRPRLDAKTPGRLPPDWQQACRDLARRNSILVMGQVEISFFGWPRDLMGVENLLMAYYEQPELVHAINRQHLDFLKSLYGPIMDEVEYDFIFMWEDMAFKNGPLISPAFFREFMMPYYKELIAFFKNRRPYKVIADSDGDITQLIPLFIEAGVDGLLPFECAAGMDIVTIARQYPRLILYGGIDKREIAKGRKAIDAELEKKLHPMFRRGGYLPSMDHHVPPGVSFEDFKYYIQSLRDIHRQHR
jgi:uroporphyrinogen decarboxylase